MILRKPEIDDNLVGYSFFQMIGYDKEEKEEDDDDDDDDDG